MSDNPGNVSDNPGNVSGQRPDLQLHGAVSTAILLFTYLQQSSLAFVAGCGEPSTHMLTLHCRRSPSQ